MKKVAVGYVRVSTGGQFRDGISKGMQILKIIAYCALNEISLAGIYGDGKPGKKMTNRPGLQSVIHLVRTRKVDAVVILKLDRLARNTRETLEMVSLMERRGVALHSISESLDTSTPIGRFFLTVIASLAELEAEFTGERVRDCWDAKRAKGEKLGGSVQYGFRADRTRGGPPRLVPHVAEQMVLRRVRTLRKEGCSLRKVSKCLADEGIFNRKGLPFGKTSIERMLRSA